jgi:hypothetical protein
MSQYAPEKPKNIVPFAPGSKDGPRDENDVERSGHAIVALLQEAAEVARSNCDRAMDVAHKLSGQLRASEDRAKQLEADVRHYQDRAMRAEKWLLRVYKEIEEKFFTQNAAPNSGQAAHRDR